MGSRYLPSSLPRLPPPLFFFDSPGLFAFSVWLGLTRGASGLPLPTVVAVEAAEGGSERKGGGKEGSPHIFSRAAAAVKGGLRPEVRKERSERWRGRNIFPQAPYFMN